MELTPRVCVIVEVIDHAIVNMDLEPDTEPGFFGHTGIWRSSVRRGDRRMTMTIGVDALIGVALGLRFKVLVLIPTIILAAVSTAVIQAARGYQASSIIVTIVLVATTLQIGYLFGNYRTRGIRETCSAQRK